MFLRQSTATTLLLGPFVDAADATVETGLTLSQADILLWKEGGTTLAQKNESTSCTHRSNGMYTCPLNTTDTNTLGTLEVSVAESGTMLFTKRYLVLPANVYDSLVLGTDTLDVQVTGMGAGTVTAAAIATGAIDADAIADNAIDAGAIAADAITAAKVASDVGTEIGTAVWATAARTLTALDEDSTTLDLDATIRSAVGLASANLDTQLDDLPTNTDLATALGTADDAVLAQVALVKAVTDKLDDTLEDQGGGTYGFTEEALQEAPGGGGGGTDLFVLRSGTAQAGTSDTITLDSGASAVNDAYRLSVVSIRAGTGAGQSRHIGGYVGSTKVATVTEPFDITPDNTSEFVVGPFGVSAATVDAIVDGIYNVQVSEHQIVGSRGESMPVDVIRISGDGATADALEDLPATLADLSSRLPDALDNGYLKASVKRVGLTTLNATGAGGQKYGAG